VYPQNPFPPDKAIWRARVNEDAYYNPIVAPFTKKSEISYLKKTPLLNYEKYERCNLPKESVFYGSDGREVAACEVCHGTLDKKHPILYLTVGEWKLKKAINVSIICHSKKAHRTGSDLIEAYQSVLALKKQTAKNKSEIRQWKIINKALANEFSKTVPTNEEYKYMFSALYTHCLLKSGKSSGVFYPSVGYRFYGHNVAYNTELIDNGTLVLEKVHHVKCTFVSKKKPPKIDIIESTNTFRGDDIIWKSHTSPVST
jgi:hypothetical protein